MRLAAFGSMASKGKSIPLVTPEKVAAGLAAVPPAYLLERLAARLVAGLVKRHPVVVLALVAAAGLVWAWSQSKSGAMAIRQAS